MVVDARKTGGPLHGRIAGLYRHPVKGLTPEPLRQARLVCGRHFPCDRLYAVELGPSGYDPRHPVYLRKTSFAVLANTPRLAAARTEFDERRHVLRVTAPAAPGLEADLAADAGRQRLARWLEAFLGHARPDRPLRVLEAVDGFRFMDDAKGHVSVINLDSLRDLEARLGRPLDPLRFRANVYVEGWGAWSELDLPDGATIRLGGVALRRMKPIKRCVATHVNTTTGERDLDVVGGLVRSCGHPFLGLYLSVEADGVLGLGDAAAAG